MGPLLTEIIGHLQGISSVRFSPDGSRLLTDSWDETARLWDASNGKELATFRAHIWPILAVAWFSDGSRAITASDGFRVGLPMTGEVKQEVPLFASPRPIWDVDVSADGLLLLTGCDDGTIALWSLQSLEQVWQSGGFGRVRCVRFSPDEKRVVAASANQSEVRLLDSGTGETVRELPGHEGRVAAAAFSPDGRHVATGPGTLKPGTGTFVRENGEQFLRIWEVETGRELLRLEGHTKSVSALAYLSDAARLISGSDDGTLRLWDVSGTLDESIDRIR